MKDLARKSVLLMVLGILASSSGCAKKDAEATAAAGQAQPVAKLAGSDEAMAALNKKDYQATVAAIMKAKEGATSKEDEAALANLIDDVKVRLIQEAPRDSKAAEALLVVRRLGGSR